MSVTSAADPVLFFTPESGPGMRKSLIRDNHPGSATLPVPTHSITGYINTDSRKGKSPESVEPASKGLNTPTGVGWWWEGGC